jgi:hypothetical protein
MLTKNPDSGQVSAAVKGASRKRVLGSSAPATEIINEPKPDWVPPWKAPFYCFSDSYIRSAGEWADALQAKVQKTIESDLWIDALKADTRKILEAEGIMEAEYRSGLGGEWSFDRATEAPGAWITAMGIQTHIEPGTVSVMPGDVNSTFDFDRWLIVGRSNEMLTYGEWDKGCGFYEILLDQKIAARWHRRLLGHLFWAWEHSYAQAIESGTAHIMARKHSVLAPFDRITWHQWQYFRLDEELPKPPKDPKWGDPRPLLDWRRSARPWTALGPGDEKLYDIHIAPGVDGSKSNDRNREDDPEEKCLQWLTELVHDYPDRPPKPRDLLAQEAVSKFPGLALNGFLRSFARVRALTQNQNWSRPGRDGGGRRGCNYRTRGRLAQMAARPPARWLS